MNWEPSAEILRRRDEALLESAAMAQRETSAFRGAFQVATWVIVLLGFAIAVLLK